MTRRTESGGSSALPPRMPRWQPLVVKRWDLSGMPRARLLGEGDSNEEYQQGMATSIQISVEGREGKKVDLQRRSETQ